MRYRVDAERSRFTVHATSGGMLSMLAHNPTFAAKTFVAELRWQPDSTEDMGFEMAVKADSLKLQGDVSPADRADVEGRMLREVLEVSKHPTIEFEAEEIVPTSATATRQRLQLTGPLSLHGVSKRISVDAEMVRYEDGVRLQGEFSLAMSEYGIRPVTALGGAIQLRDPLRIAFDLVAWQEA